MAIKSHAWALLAAIAVTALILPVAVAAKETRPPASIGLAMNRGLPGVSGAPIADVGPTGTAARIGLKTGDIVTALNGVAVDSPVTFFHQSRRYRAGDELTFTVLRGGKQMTFKGIADARENEVADRAAVRAIVDDLARTLEARYVLPEVGARYATMLRAKLAEGAYFDLPDETALGERVTADLKASHEDRHLMLAPIRNTVVTTNLARSGTAPKPIEKLARLTADIAYMRFGRAADEDAILNEVTSFIERNADAKTFIIDLRTARLGGRPTLPRTILPYFFAAPTPLVWQDFRKNVYDEFAAAGETVTLAEDRRIDGPEGYVRFAQTAMPHATETRLRGAKVYVLTSEVTGSAWELLALSFQTSGRGTVIGETTAGRGNPGRWVTIANSFRALIPHGRLIDPRNGRVLEGHGVEPTIKVSSGEALIEALVRSGVGRTKAAELSLSVGAIAADMEAFDPPPSPV